MNFGVARTKLALAVATASVLGTLVIDQGDAAGLLALPDESGRAEYVPLRSGRHHLRVFLTALARVAPTGTAPVGDALRRAAALMRRRGLIVVLSDFYEDAAALTEIKRLRRMGHDVIVIHTLAPEEVTLPPGGAVEFEDLETGARLVVNPSVLRPEYESAVAQFLDSVRRAVEGEGLDYVRLLTNEPLEPALRRLLIERRGGA